MPDTFNYALSTIDDSSISNVREITESEYKKFVEYTKTLNKITWDEKLFRIVELNYFEFKSRIDLYLNNYEKEPNADFNKMEHLFLDLNRLILNYLSAVRSYLDHTETRFKREFGNESEEIKLFESETASAYDGNFSYRFLYRLRNYSQHCGLPTGSVNINSELGEKGEPINTLNLFLIRDDLLSKFGSWGNPIKSELEKLDQTINIIPFIDSNFNILKAINEKINTPLYSRNKIAANELLSLLKEVGSLRGAPGLIRYNIKEGKLDISISWFPYETISKITGAIINIFKPEKSKERK